MKTIPDKSAEDRISREEALKKAGKYALFTATASLILLAPKSSLAQGVEGNSYYKRSTGGGPVAPPDGGGSTSGTLFTKPASPYGSSGLKDTPWK